MSPKLPLGCLTVTLRKWGDSVIINDEDGNQIAQIYAQVQNSEINDRIRVSIRAEQKYRIVRHKDGMSQPPAHFYEELLNERGRVITELRTRLFDLQQQSRMLGVIGGVIDSNVEFDRAKAAEEIKSLLQTINRKVP